MKQTLILLPGWSGNASLWEHQSQHLADFTHPEVILFDPECSRDEMAKRVLDNAPECFYLAGHSMGGWVAQKVAALAPNRVIKLVLLDTWARPDPKLNQLQLQILEQLKRDGCEKIIDSHLSMVLHPTHLHDSALVTKLKQSLLKAKPQVLIRQMQAMLDDNDSTNLCPLVQAPTLVVHSKQDLLFSEEEALFLAEKINGAKLAIIEDCGHMSPVEQPQAVTSLMRFFLKNC